MTEELKTTNYHSVEDAYSCPYCFHTQGYTDYFDEDNYGEKQCDECRKHFLVVKTENCCNITRRATLEEVRNHAAIKFDCHGLNNPKSVCDHYCVLCLFIDELDQLGNKND